MRRRFAHDRRWTSPTTPRSSPASPAAAARSGASTRWSIPPGSSSFGRSRGSRPTSGTASSTSTYVACSSSMREAMPHLKASVRGRVVNIASDAGKTGFALLGAYCASKFGVVGLTQAIAAEVAPDRVRVNAVCPGTIAETGMGAVGHRAEDRARLRRRRPTTSSSAEPRRFPLRRVGTVSDVVDADHVPDLGELRLDHRRVDQHRRRLARRLSAPGVGHRRPVYRPTIE